LTKFIDLDLANKSNKRVETKFSINKSQAAALSLATNQRRLLGRNYSQAILYDVSSLYFDSRANEAFISNLEGDSNRKKWRLRMYTKELEVQKSGTFEVKIKTGALGYKLKVPMIFSSDFIGGVSIFDEDLKGLKFLEPRVVVSYQRLSVGSKTHRLSIDQNIRGRLVNKNFQTILNIPPLEYSVLEVKAPSIEDKFLASLHKNFRIHQTSVSKYVKILMRAYRF
jgi:hypothetical protein